MLDLGFLRDNPEVVKKKLEERGVDWAIFSTFQDLDQQRRTLINRTETYRAEINLKSQEMGKDQQKLKQMPDGEEKKKFQKWLEDERLRLRGQKELLANEEPKLKEVEANLASILQNIPNLPHDSVPVGP